MKSDQYMGPGRFLHEGEVLVEVESCFFHKTESRGQVKVVESQEMNNIMAKAALSEMIGAKHGMVWVTYLFKGTGKIEDTL